MKNKLSSLLTGIIAIIILQFALISTQAQIVATNGNVVIINNFDTTDQVVLNNNLTGTAFPWINWFGYAFSNIVWDASDANPGVDNPGSGSMQIQALFPNANLGGCCGSQFVAYCGNSPFNPPFNGFGNTTPNVPIVTNFTCDVRFDPSSGTNANGTFPTLEFGTRGVDFGQHDFGTMTIQSTNTNWVHVSIPLAQNSLWTNIPNVFVKIFSGTIGTTNNPVPVNVFVDNLEFQLGIPQIPNPTSYIQPATPVTRIFAQGGQYSRTQVATTDTNQSWVGGSYPVSYSFTITGASSKVNINEFHAFWLPLAFQSALPINQYSDYSTAYNSFRLLVTQALVNGPVVAELDWKTNLLNSNPTNVVLLATNNTLVGTWTITFSSASTGTLTMPGSSAAVFTLNDANVSADFANPMQFVVGMQPDATTSIGAYVDVTHVQTVNVASPGVPVNYNLTTGTIDSNVLLTASVSTTPLAVLPIATTNIAWWVYWTTPDIGYGLATTANIGANNWSTPGYYAGYPTNGPTQLTVLNQGAYNWAMIPFADLPSVDGTSNGVKAAQAFFRVQKPPPAQ